MDYTLKCKHCGNNYTAHRTDSQYCSSSCRNFARRKRQSEISLQNLAYSVPSGLTNNLLVKPSIINRTMKQPSLRFGNRTFTEPVFMAILQKQSELLKLHNTLSEDEHWKLTLERQKRVGGRKPPVGFFDLH